LHAPIRPIPARLANQNPEELLEEQPQAEGMETMGRLPAVETNPTPTREMLQGEIILQNNPCIRPPSRIKVKNVPIVRNVRSEGKRGAYVPGLLRRIY